MTTISQLPPAGPVGPTDELPIDQGGTCYAVTVSELLAGSQTAITLANGTLLGRASSGSGGPEQITLGAGLAMNAGALVIDGVTGPAGPPGPAGSQGAAGPVGATGQTGPAGASMEVGDGAPAAGAGSSGDVYLDAATGTLWTNDTSWR